MTREAAERLRVQLEERSGGQRAYEVACTEREQLELGAREPVSPWFVRRVR